MKNVIIIAGPTASGKTALSIELAKQFNGEIISADSMQIYKYMDIGTAKPSEFEKSGIPHYLMDEITPDEDFSVAKYKSLATKYIDEILGRNKLPIIVGGTGLYINSLLYNIEFSDIQTDWEYRNMLQNDSEKFGNEYLMEKLKEVDPVAASRLNINDVKRIIRALEVYKITGKTITYHQEISRQNPSEYNFKVFGLTMDRAKLYQRINSRVDKMIEEGLIEEVKKIIEMGYGDKKISMQAVGYKEIIQYLDGIIRLDEALELIKMSSRRLAKRQLTWFRRVEGMDWIDMDNVDLKEILKKVKDIVASDNNI